MSVYGLFANSAFQDQGALQTGFCGSSLAPVPPECPDLFVEAYLKRRVLVYSSAEQIARIQVKNLGRAWDVGQLVFNA